MMMALMATPSLPLATPWLHNVYGIKKTLDTRAHTSVSAGEVESKIECVEENSNPSE